MASSDEIKKLQNRIAELETEVSEREKDIALYRNELLLANSRLQTFVERMNVDVQVLKKIHRALVPTEIPHIPGFDFSSKFIPSLERGGDYFDVFEHEDKFRFGIVMAGSSGYSISALFLSVLLKLTGQMEARKGLQPEEVFKKIVSELAPQMLAPDHASLFYGVIDRRTYELKYVASGPLQMLLYQNQKQRLEKLEHSAEPIKRDTSLNFTPNTVQLNPRDRLVFSTEGLLKVKNPKGEVFATERLFKAILGSVNSGVHDLRNEILYQAEKFSDSTPYPQDVTLLIAEVKDKVIKLAK